MIIIVNNIREWSIENYELELARMVIVDMRNCLFCYVIHYIRVKQLMLIAKTKKVFKLNLVIRYVILLVVSLCWLGGCHIHIFPPG